MTAYPRDSEAKKAIRAGRKEFGWSYSDAVGNSAHGIGRLTCGDGCDIRVYGTADNTARALWDAMRGCPHGHRPDRRHW